VVYTTSVSQEVQGVHIVASEIDTGHFFEGGFNISVAATVTASKDDVVKAASCYGSVNGSLVK
jgi:hypothetical protein